MLTLLVFNIFEKKRYNPLKLNMSQNKYFYSHTYHVAALIRLLFPIKIILKIKEGF
jgi:hypothetical protein